MSIDAASVVNAIVALGRRSRGRVRLGDLKRQLGMPPQPEFARVLLDLQEAEAVILMRNDNPPDITPEDWEAAVYIAGNPRHLVFLQ